MMQVLVLAATLATLMAIVLGARPTTHVLSTSAGCPVQRGQIDTAFNRDLIRNEYFLDSLSHVVRERIPERVVHAKGAGAFGDFEVTHDVTDLTKAKFLRKVGRKTRVATRFSTIATSKGSNDLVFTVRGFAVKFYTEEGNFDIPGFNIPIFPLRDPLKFVSLVHAFAPDPATNLFDTNMAWDFTVSDLQSALSTVMGFSTFSLPDSYRHIDGFGIHTMQLANRKNETIFSRFYLTSNQGVSSFTLENATSTGAADPDYLVRDLSNAIKRGDHPSWTVHLQPLTLADVESAKNKGIDVFDVTRLLPIEDYPLRQVGKLTLNENPKNFFADVEQLAFCPGNVVPGILGAPDQLFAARALAYREAAIYRLGANFNKIPVNRPLGKIFTYDRDGAFTYDDNGGGAPIYYPNSFNGPEPVPNNQPSLVKITEFETSNIEQARKYLYQISEESKQNIVKNIAVTLHGLTDVVRSKVNNYFNAIDRNLANRIAKAQQELTDSC